MKITVLNEAEFKQMLVSKDLNSDTIESRTDLCFISITNSNVQPFMRETSNCLPLTFDDITDKDNMPEFILFKEDQAVKIIQFCVNNKDRRELLVHCTGGISRSGAVGLFINDIWGEDSYQNFMKLNPRIYPNIYVKCVLQRTYDYIRYSQMS